MSGRNQRNEEETMAGLLLTRRRMAKVALVVLFLSLIGCARGVGEKSVRLDELAPGSPYAQLREALTVKIEIGGARIHATLLHKAMLPYQAGIPEKGLSILFYIEGRKVSWLAPKDMIYVIEDGKGRRVILSGAGTDHFAARNESGDPVPGAGFIPLGTVKRLLAGQVVNRFILVLPFELDKDLTYLQIRGENVKDPKVRFVTRWKFI
jgi:hypothetical protein